MVGSKRGRAVVKMLRPCSLLFPSLCIIVRESEMKKIRWVKGIECRKYVRASVLVKPQWSLQLASPRSFTGQDNKINRCWMDRLLRALLFYLNICFVRPFNLIKTKRITKDRPSSVCPLLMGKLFLLSDVTPWEVMRSERNDNIVSHTTGMAQQQRFECETGKTNRVYRTRFILCCST